MTYAPPLSEIIGDLGRYRINSYDETSWRTGLIFVSGRDEYNEVVRELASRFQKLHETLDGSVLVRQLSDKTAIISKHLFPLESSEGIGFKYTYDNVIGPNISLKDMEDSEDKEYTHNLCGTVTADANFYQVIRFAQELKDEKSLLEAFRVTMQLLSLNYQTGQSIYTILIAPILPKPSIKPVTMEHNSEKLMTQWGSMISSGDLELSRVFKSFTRNFNAVFRHDIEKIVSRETRLENQTRKLVNCTSSFLAEYFSGLRLPKHIKKCIKYDTYESCAEYLTHSASKSGDRVKSMAVIGINNKLDVQIVDNIETTLIDHIRKTRVLNLNKLRLYSKGQIGRTPILSSRLLDVESVDIGLIIRL